MHRQFRLWRTLAALVFAAACATASIAATATDPQQAKEKLSAVRTKIADLTRQRGKELAERDALSAHLRDVELEVTAKRQALEGLQGAAAAAAQRRSELLAERQRTEGMLDGERSSLAAEARLVAMMGPQQEIKLLLNQTDARRLGRMLTWEGYFSRARAAHIAAITAELAQLNSLTEQIGAQSTRYQLLASDAGRQLAALLQARATRTTLLVTLASQVRSADQQLAKLKREEQAV